MALLEEAGYKVHEQGKLTRHYVLNVLMHAKDKEGRLVLQYAGEDARPLSRRDELRLIYRRRGFSEWRIPELIARQEQRDLQQQAEQEADRRRGKEIRDEATVQRFREQKEAALRQAREAKRGG